MFVQYQGNEIIHKTLILGGVLQIMKRSSHFLKRSFGSEALKGSDGVVLRHNP
jgi:hypothetical protein